MNAKFFVIAVCALFSLAASHADAQDMQPGMYASINAVELANGQKRAHPGEECITAKDIADGLAKVGIEGDADCKVQNLVKGNGKITYRLVCEEDGKKQLADVSGNYTANSYEFSIKAVTPGPGYKAINVTGKRIGECK